MARWQPNADGRLAESAMELYMERGYEQTTVAEIAERAGLTERTFFRHFADKREVLFAGSSGLQDLLAGAVADAPAEATPIEAIGAGLDAAAETLGARREFAQRRQAIIAANAELQERELIKLASLATAMADALAQRGVRQPAARLTAEAGIAVFRVAFERWVEQGNRRSLTQLMRESLEELRAQLVRS
jgi:AcrR family transcriptional regulator